MPFVETVAGPTDTRLLGRTLMHEHIFSLYPEVRVQDSSWDEEERVRDAVDKLADVVAVGFSTLVDLTVYGLGRNVPRVQRVAERAAINVIVATGIYFFTDLPPYFKARLALCSPTYIEDLFVDEIQRGIFDTGVKAGIIKCVTDAPGLTPDIETVLRAAARAQLRTGVPISTHTNARAETGLLQQRIFAEEGVDLVRVVIGHSGDTTDLAYLQSLIDAGSYVGMDRFGAEMLLSFEDRVRTVAALCARGLADRIVLSHDTNCWSDSIPPEVRAQSRFARMRHTHIGEDVLPALRAAGVSDTEIDKMVISNPATVLAAQG